jgi:hypothetical protein|tara:strand:+ start:12450 stop:12902 length:453 start_codon:yes stop_codon:yes gene_type:complete
MNYKILLIAVIILFMLLLGFVIYLLITATDKQINLEISTNNDNNNNDNTNEDPIYPMSNTDFQQLGTLSSMDDTNTILPLFGKKLFKDRWTYYTTTDGEQNLRIEIIHSERNCMKDQIGCDMIYNDDVVTIPSYNNKQFKVFLYNYSTPF